MAKKWNIKKRNPFKNRKPGHGRYGKAIEPFTPCGYCFQAWAREWDHILPVAAGGRTVDENMYPSCHRCNCIAGKRVFGSLDEKRKWIQGELVRRKPWKSAESEPCAGTLPGVRVADDPQAPLATVLQHAMPLGGVERGEPKASGGSQACAGLTVKPHIPKTYPQATCPQCGRLFPRKRPSKKFCHKLCGNAWRQRPENLAIKAL